MAERQKEALRLKLEWTYAYMVQIIIKLDYFVVFCFVWQQRSKISDMV